MSKKKKILQIFLEFFAYRACYTKTLLLTNPFTYRPCYTQTLVHTNRFTHTDACERIARTSEKLQLYLNF